LPRDCQVKLLKRFLNGKLEDNNDTAYFQSVCEYTLDTKKVTNVPQGSSNRS
jgi:hypothetical protein